MMVKEQEKFMQLKKRYADEHLYTFLFFFSEKFW